MHVYVIEAPHGCKIGRSIQPTTRLRNIETQGGFEITRAWVSLPTGSAPAVERKSHALLSDCRAQGEWFDVSFSDAVDTVSSALSEYEDEKDGSLGQRIASGRQKLGLNQSELASRINVSRQVVSFWEGREIRSISGRNLQALAQELDVTADYLLTGRAPSPYEYSPRAHADIHRRIDNLESSELDQLCQLLDDFDKEKRRIFEILKERFEPVACHQ